MERRRMTRLAGLSLALALAAGGGGCRGLLGIEDDGPLLTSGADAAGGQEGGTGADGSARADASVPDEGDAGLTAVDRRFAQWPVPPPSPLLSQYELAPETVTDKITTLVWQRAISTPVTMSYPAALAYCADLAIGGQSDWRLPTRMELMTILDYGRSLAGMLNLTVFPDGAQPGGSSVAWTASFSLLRATLDDHVNVDVVLGTVDVTNIAQSSLLVRCVRGGPTTSPVARYVVGNGTARDVRTGLVWQLAPMPTMQSFAGATAACTALSLGGFASGWRLPSVRELVSLLDESREQTPLLPSIFAAGPTPKLWSSTVRKNPNNASYAVDFTTASVSAQEYGVDEHSVRCVR